MFSHLTGYRVNLALLQQNANKDFIDLIERAEGSKAIVWDLENLSNPALNLMIDSTLLKQYKDIRHIAIKSGALPVMDVKNVIFITRPEIYLMDYIAENLLSENSEERNYKGIRKDYHLYFIPRKSEFCKKRLEDKNVYGSFSHVSELKWIFYPLDKDVISMERKSVYHDLTIDGDQTCLFEAALGIVELQKCFGRIPKVYGKGNFAEKIWEHTKTLGREEKSMFNSDKGSIDQMIILDRSVDLMSTLATQLTYEGLIDENFGINENIVRLQMDPINLDEKKTYFFNSSEDLYAELRDKNFNEVGLILSQRAKEISKLLEEKHNDKSVQEMKKFVEGLPDLMAKKQSIATHTTVGEMIKDIADSPKFLDDLAAEQEFISCMNTDKASGYIEDLIAKEEDFKKIIRLICVQCIAGSGFKSKILDYYKRELVHVYGIQALLTIGNLEKAEIIKKQTETRSYAVLKKTFNLTVDEVKEISPNDISYVHSFYAPLSIRIIEHMLKPNGWMHVKNALNILPCSAFEDFQAPLKGLGGRRSSYASEKSHTDPPKVILVFFVGGCTFAEISALRFLSRQKDTNAEFVIATTKVINKNTFLESFMEKLSE